MKTDFIIVYDYGDPNYYRQWQVSAVTMDEAARLFKLSGVQHKSIITIQDWGYSQKKTPEELTNGA